ncbi:unnamed protein product [Effrenium voratum]|nr:unnamed protein product [Effrenium voratum]
MAALLLLRARLCAPCCRHISAGKFGKPMHIGAKPQAPAIRSRPEVKVAGSGRIGSPLPTLGTSPHLRALQRLSDMVPGFRGLDMMSSYRDRQARLRARADQQHQSDIFNEAKRFMMEPEMWTFGSMLAYQRKLMDLLGAHSFRRRFATDDPSLAYLEKALRVLEAMTPVELASNHKRVFTPQAIELIGEKSNTSARFVKQVILEHDILRGDRRWYQILAQFDRPQPQSFEDRSFMAEYDRPFSETEIEMRQEFGPQPAKGSRVELDLVPSSELWRQSLVYTPPTVVRGPGQRGPEIAPGRGRRAGLSFWNCHRCQVAEEIAASLGAVCAQALHLGVSGEEALRYFGNEGASLPLTPSMLDSLNASSFASYARRGVPVVIKHGLDGTSFDVEQKPAEWTCDAIARRFPTGRMKMEYTAGEGRQDNPISLKDVETWSKTIEKSGALDPEAPQYAELPSFAELQREVVPSAWHKG